MISDLSYQKHKKGDVLCDTHTSYHIHHIHSARTKQMWPGPGCNVAQIIVEFFSVTNVYLEVALMHCSYVSSLASLSAIRFS